MLRNILAILLFFASLHFSQSQAQSTSQNIWELKGILEVLITDYMFDKDDSLRYFVDVKEGYFAGQKIEILFPKPPATSLLTGDELELQGQWIREKNLSLFYVHSWTVLKSAALKPSALKSRTAVFLRLNFSDSNASLSEAQVASQMEMNRNWFLKASYNQTDFPVDIDSNSLPDVYSLNIDYAKTQGCDASAISQKAVAAAQAAGINMSLYQHRVFILPPANCAWSGLAHVGCGSTCNVWVASPNWDLVYPHELGHNLGMQHAATDINDDGNIESEYGDGSCPMGAILSRGFFNAPHTLQMQWLTEAAGNVKTINTSGEYILYAPGQDINLYSPQIIRFSKDSSSFYYLGYRPLADFDVPPQEFGSGVSIYSASGGSKTRLIRTLSNGESWESAAVKVQQLEKTAAYTKVAVQFECFRSILMTMTPAIATVFPGKSAAFAVELTNKNEATCEPININLNSVLPAGFQLGFSAQNISIPPGETKTIPLQLETTLLGGAYKFSVQGTNTKNNQTFLETSRVYVQGRPINFLPGLTLKYYKGSWSQVPDFATLIPDEEKIAETVSLGTYTGERTGLVFNGFIKIESAGKYTFYLTSDDGSKMYLRDTLFINNDGLHGATTKLNAVYLQPGLYPLKIEFFQLGGGTALELKWQKDGNTQTPVPASAFFYLDSTIRNAPPTVDAGGDENVVNVQNYTITGSAVDTDGSIVSYEWQKLSGPSVNLLNSNSSSLTLQNLQTGDYVFRLTATDNDGATAFDEKKLTVNNNLPPVVDAGPDEIIVKSQYHIITGSAVDNDGKIVSHRWQKLSGPSVVLVNPGNYKLTLQDLEAGEYVFRLIAKDDKGASRFDDKKLIVFEPNQAPKVYAGEDISAHVGETVLLRGTAQDDGSLVQAGWRLVNGPLGASYSLAPLSIIDLTYSFVPSLAGSYVYEFFATDNEGWTQSDQVIVTVN